MLAVTLIHFGLLFVYGNPEWKPLVTALPRAAAVRRLLHLARPVHLEPDEEPDRRRRRRPSRVFLLLWVIDWIGSASGRRRRRSCKYLSITDHFDDFVKGVIDTKHVIYYLSFITFGLFLTAKSVDSERWRG